MCLMNSAPPSESGEVVSHQLLLGAGRRSEACEAFASERALSSARRARVSLSFSTPSHASPSREFNEFSSERTSPRRRLQQRAIKAMNSSRELFRVSSLANFHRKRVFFPLTKQSFRLPRGALRQRKFPLHPRRLTRKRFILLLLRDDFIDGAQ